MKITALLENTTHRTDMQTEHGLSLFIETKEKKILFDMGQTDLFDRNARACGIDIADADIAVLSHGHYDHGGGLQTFFSRSSGTPVYIHRDAFQKHCNGTEKYIGLDPALADDPRIVYTDNVTVIGDGLTLYTCNDKPRRAPIIPHGLTELVDDHFIDDDFRHEQYLLIEEDGLRVLISGCSHKGILDLADWFEPDVLVGGFHYSKLDPSEVLAAAAKSLAGHKTVFYTCHCTGEVQYTFMKQFMPNLHYLSCGESILLSRT